MKKLLLTALISCGVVTGMYAQQKVKSSGADARALKKAERREKINQLIKQEEEGALIYQKQGAFGFKFNTDGWGMFYEHGKYKTITTTNLWWMELGEHKHPKEEKVPTLSASQGFLIISSYIYGKRNNFYDFKLGFGQQKLIGSKGNKNGVAVTAIYGGGFSAGLLKPYYIEIQNPSTGKREEIKYDNNDSLFLDPTIILGKGGLTKGFNEIKFVPGFHARAAMRFDYGRYNEILSALEVGVNAEYYTQSMPILLLNKDKKFFFNAYIALVFGKRK
ncbi:MAG: hypothetical protein JO301_03645 [Chitinophagaceae bacterium]|nr:hypothetical protein [Chitinophagaceae bacterium]